MKKIIPAAIVILACVYAGQSLAQSKPVEPVDIGETQARHDVRMAWWRDARFGMFIHWGLYAVPAGTYKGKPIDNYGEWIMAVARIPSEDYQQYARMFYPAWYDAQQWASLAARAGMKYVVITSKHHDGFSMFDSKYSDYDIVDSTPYRRDVMAPLAKACREAGLAFGFYYSILDWHHPSQAIGVHEDGSPDYPHTRMLEGKKDEYVRFMKNQLRELVSKYDPDILWFDGEWVPWWTKEDGRMLEEYVRGLKPSVIVNNRVGKREPDDGDFGTPEQEIPDTGLDYDWETCMTINKTWGFKAFDDDWKSTEKLLKSLADIASKGGNFLLNVGPTADGCIPYESVVRLEAMGQWLDVNGAAIYGTSPSPYEKPAWGRYTRKGDTLFALVFEWPDTKTITVPMMTPRVASVRMLGSGRVNFRVGEEITLERIGEMSETPIEVVEIEFTR